MNIKFDITEDDVRTILLGYVDYSYLIDNYNEDGRMDCKIFKLENLCALCNANENKRQGVLYPVEKIENNIIHIVVPKESEKKVFWYDVYTAYLKMGEFDIEICGHFPYKFIEAKIKIRYI